MVTTCDSASGDKQSWLSGLMRDDVLPLRRTGRLITVARGALRHSARSFVGTDSVSSNNGRTVNGRTTLAQGQREDNGWTVNGRTRSPKFLPIRAQLSSAA
jgi:hypothetical protein